MESTLYTLLSLLLCLSFLSGSDIYPSIHWVPENPIFEADGNTCGPGPRYLKVRLNSKISFLCPNLATVLQKSTTAIQTSEMYENLWFLENKTAFDACDTSLDPKARRLLTCSSPTTLVFSTMIFLQFTAQIGGLEFQGGRTYYLIATSDGTQSHLNDGSGGHCNDTENNVYMKIEVYVCEKGNQTATDPKCASGVGNLRCPSPITVTSSSSVAIAIASSQTTPAIEESSTRLTLHPSMSATMSALRQSLITRTASSAVMTSCPNTCNRTACYEAFQDMCEVCHPSSSSSSAFTSRVNLPNPSVNTAGQEQRSGNENSNNSGTWRTMALSSVAVPVILVIVIVIIISVKNRKGSSRRPRRPVAPHEVTSKETELSYSTNNNNNNNNNNIADTKI